MKKYDAIFFYGGAPVPAMIDMVKLAHDSGLSTLMIVLDRGENELCMDHTAHEFDTRVISVDFSHGLFRRVLSLLRIFVTVFRLLRSSVKTTGYVMSSTFDTLLLVRCAFLPRSVSIRHQVRDLHRLQLIDSPVARLVQAMERVLVRKVDLLIISSQGFYDAYYKMFYGGEKVLLENMPPRATWEGFKPLSPPIFTVGFVGIMRYADSIFKLIDVIDSVNTCDTPIRCAFFGGHMGDLLERARDRVRDPGIFLFEGVFDYAADIKRIYSKISVVYAVYDKDDPNCMLAMPTKYYEAILSKTPILVAKNTHIAKVVEELGIGIGVDVNDDSLSQALTDAIHCSGWYINAQRVLSELTAEQLHSSYERAIVKAVT